MLFMPTNKVMCKLIQRATQLDLDTLDLEINNKEYHKDPEIL